LKVLILKPSSLGDVVQALPVLRLIKRHHPQSQIYWWLAAEYLPLLEKDPDLAGLIPFDRRHWMTPGYWLRLARTVRKVRHQHFDWVIDLQSLARSGLFAWLASGSLTVGLDEAREGAYTFYDLAVPRPSPRTHAVLWYLQVLPLLDVPVHWDFEWLPARPDIAAVLQSKWRPGAEPWLAIHPGARWANKRWPAESYADLVARLAKAEPSLRFAILGSAKEKRISTILMRAAPERCLDLTGQTTLPELVEWIRLSELIVTNDTGPMHVAAALGKPVVAMYGPTDPERTGPFGQVDRVLRLDLPCEPCLRPVCKYHQPMECLRAIRPEVVAHEVQRRLHGSAAGRARPLVAVG
jgi:heptosyltransferase-1